MHGVEREKHALPRGDVPRDDPVRFRSHWWQGCHGGVCPSYLLVLRKYLAFASASATGFCNPEAQ
jgi:hypothetical protein